MWRIRFRFQKYANITNYVSQVNSSIEFLKILGFQTIDLIGTSYAGMVVLITAMKNEIEGIKIRKIFLRAPMLDWESNFIDKYGKEKLMEWQKKGYRDYIKGDGTILKNQYDSMQDTKKYKLDLLAHKINNEIQVIQGDLDTDCPLKTAQKIIPMFPNAKMHIIVGAAHNLGVNGDFSKGIIIMKDFLKE